MNGDRKWKARPTPLFSVTVSSGAVTVAPGVEIHSVTHVSALCVCILLQLKK